ncbi:uncharacterized protein LOC128951345 [Oppia nitens]|uniref:uncharacterized protein LOC128951345 n=1 Tax=Oppia nitens TaxID=1686743 RepID=UPI0023DAB782|nr:uncharacterized protein LOC128951345 [Oppia nitens]
MHKNSVAIAWSNLTVCSKQWTGSPKVILRQLFGQINFGTITGLMGASGSGKTTLIKCLNASNQFIISDDSRLYCSKTKSIVKRYIGQDQSDKLIDGLTVGEALSYSSKVNNSYYKNVKHEENMTQLMTQLLINDIKDTTIEKCSGGQRQRIAIALQLTSIEKPNLLFMDEPTTGLDSNAAFELMKCLQSLSKTHNIAIIVSIHQPNNDLLKMFDNIYVLAKGGHTIYDGSPQQMKHYLTDCGINFNKNEVPIEVMLKISSQGIQSLNVMKLTEKILNNRNINQSNLKQIENGLQTKPKPFQLADLLYITQRSLKISFIAHRYQLSVQLILFTLFQLFGTLIISDKHVQIDGCFDQSYTGTCIQWEKDKYLLGISINHIAAIYYFAYTIHALIVVNKFADDIRITLSEYRNIWYSLGVMFISKFIVDTIITILYSLILTIAWMNITLNFKLNQFMRESKDIKILDDISGSFVSQSLNALMGPSGSGKTTLLKCLNAKYGYQLSADSMIYTRFSTYSSKTCFIAQNISEHLLKGLTVKQTLLYASKLKNSQIFGQLDHNKIVDDLMSELLISDIVDNCVDTCSSGERKRIVIASELTSRIKPNLLLIDEPTSGLDSNAAINIIQCLKSLSRYHHMTIVVSIHQPNNELFNIFDNIYVLAKGGHAIYEGSPQQLKQTMIDTNIHFNDDTEVPIEVLLRIASDGNHNKLVQKLSAYNRSLESLLYDRIITENMKPYDRTNILPTKRFFLKDLLTLMKRMMLCNYYANCLLNLLCITFIHPIALLIIFLYNWDIFKTDGCMDLISLAGMGCNHSDTDLIQFERFIKQNLILNILLILIITLAIVILTARKFCDEIQLIISEHSNGWYSTGVYYWSSTLVELLPFTISLAIYVYIINFYQTWHSYATYYTTYMLCIICTQCLTKISCILCRLNLRISLIVVLHLLMINTVFFNSSPNDLHYMIQYLAQVSFIKYAFECIVIMIYGWGRCSTSDDSTKLSIVMMMFDTTDENFWPNIVHIVVLVVLFHCLTLTMLIYQLGRI